MAESLKYVLTKEDEDLYVKELLQRRMLFSSRLRRKLKVQGGVTLNGKPVSLKSKGLAGDVLEVAYPEEESYFEPQDIHFGVAYEDDDILVADKPAGIVVHPTKNFQSGTLANALSFYINKKGDKYKIRFVNRLDMNTSGLFIVAKNPHAQDFLNHEMDADRVVKKYIAIVRGQLTEDGTVDAPIDKDPNHVARRHVTPDGYRSVTHYKVLKSLGDNTLIELRLETGRTHQIRVHMSYIGHPVLGDDLYDETSPLIGRQALHAAHLEFRHPVTGELITADAPIPEDMERLIK